MPKPDNKSDAELLALYDEVRRTAQEVSQKFSQTPGGDHYTWEGGMNAVDALRLALDDLDNAIIERMPDEDDEPEED